MLHVVQVRTDSVCYIFDVEAPNGQGRKAANTLKTLCEDDSIVKVMHTSTLVAEALQTQHTIQLEGIFDTLVRPDSLGLGVSGGGRGLHCAYWWSCVHVADSWSTMSSWSVCLTCW